MLRACQFFTILTSKPLWHAGGVQILRSSTSKSAPNPRCFNDFDFQIALARRRGANFGDIFCSRSFAPPRFSDLPLRALEATFAQFLPAKISPVTHLCCETSLLSNIDAARPSGNFQYSRKLELPNSKLPLIITYLPHKAVAEVSKNEEPIGKERAEFNWFESQLMSDSNELRVK